MKPTNETGRVQFRSLSDSGSLEPRMALRVTIAAWANSQTGLGRHLSTSASRPDLKITPCPLLSDP
jgi:hypothetical protein